MQVTISRDLQRRIHAQRSPQLGDPSSVIGANINVISLSSRRVTTLDTRRRTMSVLLVREGANLSRR